MLLNLRLPRCVHSAYYELATEYYKQAGPPEQVKDESTSLYLFSAIAHVGIGKRRVYAQFWVVCFSRIIK